MKQVGLLERYATIVFDCDGVLMNSNEIKTDAFREVALPYGSDKAAELVAYHQARGGISRFAKFEYFVDHILNGVTDAPDVGELVHAYAANVFEKLMTCELAQGLNELRAGTRGKHWMVVSGGAQSELREVFRQRGIDTMFDGGIFGSPDSKDHIFLREFSGAAGRLPAVYVGDSEYDHASARMAGLDFIFASAWSEFSGWPQYCEQNSVNVVRCIGDLLG